MDYKPTLNLPKTDFPMKADLARREPSFLAAWDEAKLYERVLAASSRRRAAAGEGAERFIMHDGPPYANGHTHLGTCLNKVLKDMVVRYSNMNAGETEFVPGWDCHGLPIELAVDKEISRAKKAEMGVPAFRRACREYAERFIDTQRAEFKRLGVLARWGEPYRTIDRAYEATIVRELGKFVAAGAVYRAKKPVHWCVSCRTALAQFEVEFETRKSPSIYVAFPFVDAPREWGDGPHCIAVWTTTPWTLAANLAIAVHPDVTYAAVDFGRGTALVAEPLVAQVAAKLGWSSPTVRGRISGRALERKRARHPFIDRESLIVLGEHVALDATGCVHTAPGHGDDDYRVGRAYGLEPYCPVDADGRYTAEGGEWAGLGVFDADPKIVEKLAASGALLNRPGEEIEHQYAHCWRCKKPVIYRATEQWFISLAAGGLREKALAEIDQTEWIPPWGRDRIFGMVEHRPDWCISRQRAWGVPIPALYCKGCGDVTLTPAVLEAVADRFARDGADAWFEQPASDLAPAGTSCAKCGGRDFEKERDILDVWFESGVSFAAVVESAYGADVVADLYLEGSDQHRGWFQSALLAAVATRGRAPYEAVLTHGMVVDGGGRKMSKSVGNYVAADAIMAKYGAELIRLWVASSDYRDDVRLSDEIMKGLTEAYRKVRNTFRFMLGNLYDFAPERDSVSLGEMDAHDRWALSRLADLRDRVTAAFDAYEFHTVVHAVLDFCAIDLSALYLDVAKDRLYCGAPASPRRRSTQTALWQITDALARLLSPILAFTCEEVWSHLPRRADAPTHAAVASWPDASDGIEEWRDPELEDRFARLFVVRHEVTKAIEPLRREKAAPLDVRIQIEASGAEFELLESESERLAELFIVSQVTIAPGEGDVVVRAERIETARCDRCWMRTTDVSADTSALCGRCARVLQATPL